MGQRQDSLVRMFQETGLTCLTKERPRITLQSLQRSQLDHEVLRVYQALGGRLDTPPLKPGQWDVVVEDIPIELDEERHFNRYRATTLQSTLYSELAGFEVNSYRHLCRDHEKDCLKAAGWGGNWTNNSCEKQFGTAAPLRVLEKPGAPRWKQRAFYDFLKDATSLVESRPVVRFSIWEEVETGSLVSSLGRLLETNGPGKWRAEIVSLFRRRSSFA
jgi:hypothetical protein